MAKQKQSKKFDKEEKDFKDKSKGPKDRRKIHKSKRYDRVSTDTETNSVDWYITNEQMLKDAASIQFFNPLGSETHLDKASDFPTTWAGAPTGVTYLNTSRLNASVPGVMSINYVPTIGKADDNNDPINVAARNIYAFVRKGNSGSSNYDAPNLMMYLMACDSVYTFYQWMLRLYGLLRFYSIYNQYYNEAVLQAMHVDVSAFAGNISDFRAYINQFALKANSLCVPNTFTIYQRHMYLVSALFKDTEAAKSQLYVFNPEIVYKYDDPTGSLKAVPIAMAANLLTFVDVRSIGDTLLNAIMTSGDMSIMKGDILKAFGESGIYTLAMCPEDYITQSVHDYEILTQIQAANFLGMIPFSALSTLDITEDTTQGSLSEGALQQSVTSQFVVTGSGAIPYSPTSNLGTVLNMYIDNPTPADVMVASRLSHYGVQYVQGDASSATVYNTAVWYGTEVCTRFNIWYAPNGIGAAAFNVNGVSDFINGCNSAVNYSLVNAISPFEWHPIIYRILSAVNLAATPTMDVNYQTEVDLDWDNYAILDPLALQRLHTCATLGEFRIPQMGVLM